MLEKTNKSKCCHCGNLHNIETKFCPHTGKNLTIKSGPSVVFVLASIIGIQFILIVIFLLLFVFRDTPQPLGAFESFSSISTTRENVLNFQGNVWEYQLLNDMAEAYLARNGAIDVRRQRLSNEEGTIVTGLFDNEKPVKIKIRHLKAQVAINKKKISTSESQNKGDFLQPTRPSVSFYRVQEEREVLIEYNGNSMKRQLMYDMAVAYLEKNRAVPITRSDEIEENWIKITGNVNGPSPITIKLQHHDASISQSETELSNLKKNGQETAVQHNDRLNELNNVLYKQYYNQAKSDYRSGDIKSAIRNAEKAKKRSGNSKIKKLLKILHLEEQGKIRTINIINIIEETRKNYSDKIKVIQIKDLPKEISAKGQITLRLEVNGIGNIRILEFSPKHLEIYPINQLDDIAKKIRNNIEKIDLNPPRDSAGNPIRVSYGRITYNVVSSTRGITMIKEEL